MPLVTVADGKSNPLARAEMVVRHDFTGYWLSELTGILGEPFAWWAADRAVEIDGRDAVPMALALEYIECGS